MANGFVNRLKTVFSLLANIRSFPKTIYFNFKYLDFKDAIKFPVFVYRRVKLKDLKGSIILKPKARFGLVSIGFPGYSDYSGKTAYSVWQVSGKVVFGENVYIGGSTIIEVGREAELYFGDNFDWVGNSTIRCHKKIEFGDNCLISWENLFLDSDGGHNIYDLDSDTVINQSRRGLFVGNKVWIGCRCTFLKGARVENNCIVGSGSLLNKEFNCDNVIIGGSPAKILKERIRWEY